MHFLNWPTTQRGGLGASLHNVQNKAYTSMAFTIRIKGKHTHKKKAKTLELSMNH